MKRDTKITIGFVVAAVFILAAQLVLLPSAAATTSQEESQIAGRDSGLTARLNSATFRTGDTVIVNGTVEDREPDSYVSIEVIDPNSGRVAWAFPDVTADTTFRYTFKVGPNRELDNIYAQPIETPGNYRVKLMYQQPGESLGSDDYFAELDLEFAYQP